MTNIYTTSELANRFNLHPNTLRKYEKLGLISVPMRKKNRYRIYTDEHVQQLHILKLAFSIELIHKNLRSIAYQIVQSVATQKKNQAIKLSSHYINIIQDEKNKAVETINEVKKLIHTDFFESNHLKSRKELSLYLDITKDTLRNWERNQLIISQKIANQVFFDEQNILKARIVYLLKQANFSLMAISHMFQELDSLNASSYQITDWLHMKNNQSEIYTAYDELIQSYDSAIANMIAIQEKLTIYTV